MSLSVDLLRLITVRAIKGATMVGDRVLDSANLSADFSLDADDEPFVTVYTNEASFTLQAGSVFSSEGSVDLVIEVAIAGRRKFTTEEGEEVIETVIVPSDEGLELQVGIAARQIMAALVNPANPWADLWRRFTPKRDRIRIRRGESGQSSPRFASRQIVLTVDVLEEPPVGANLAKYPVWAKFFELAEGTEIAKPARLLKGIIQANGKANTWEEAVQALTVPGRAAASLGIANVVIPHPDDEVPMERISIIDEKSGVPIDITPPEGEVQ